MGDAEKGREEGRKERGSEREKRTKRER